MATRLDDASEFANVAKDDVRGGNVLQHDVGEGEVARVRRDERKIESIVAVVLDVPVAELRLQRLCTAGHFCRNVYAVHGIEVVGERKRQPSESAAEVERHTAWFVSHSLQKKTDDLAARLQKRVPIPLRTLGGDEVHRISPGERIPGRAHSERKLIAHAGSLRTIAITHGFSALASAHRGSFSTYSAASGRSARGTRPNFSSPRMLSASIRNGSTARNLGLSS